VSTDPRFSDPEHPPRLGFTDTRPAPPATDPRIQRMAQIIHDSRVYIHPDAPEYIRELRGHPTHADIAAAHAIYESPEVRRDLAATDMPPER
jgi:hypothetical protein